MTNSETQTTANGTAYSALKGASSRFRYRSDRLSSTELNFTPVCRITGFKTDCRVINMSSTGLAVECNIPLDLRSGQILKGVSVMHNGQLFWAGSIEVSSVAEDKKSAGFRVIGGRISLSELHFRDEFLEYRLDKYLVCRSQQSASLPSDWRANVSELHSMLCEIHTTLDEYQKSDAENRWRDPELSKRLCAAAFQKWAPPFLKIAAKLDERSEHFNADTKELALNFAQTLLMRELIHGEVQRRAYEKPQGYAGDFRMMELTQADQLEGETLFQRFLLYFSQEMSLGQTVCARGKVAYDAIRESALSDRPIKIVSLASGPAMELRKFVRQVETLEHKIDIFLIDQDEDALRNCLNALNKICAERGDNPRIEFHCLHFSLRQIIAPQKGAEKELVDEVLSEADLIYSMGLFDYLPQKLAKRTVSELFDLLSSGGKLLIGNLVRSADSSWLIEYATAWHLTYRDQEMMADLGAELNTGVKTISDETKRCLFLEAIKS